MSKRTRKGKSFFPQLNHLVINAVALLLISKWTLFVNNDRNKCEGIV